MGVTALVCDSVPRGSPTPIQSVLETTGGIRNFGVAVAGFGGHRRSKNSEDSHRCRGMGKIGVLDRNHVDAPRVGGD